MSKNIKKIKKVLKPYKSDIHGLYVRLNTDSELNENEVYKIEFVLIIESEYPMYEMSDEKRSEYDNVLENVVKLLQKNTKIKVIKPFVGTLEDISVGYLRRLEEWCIFDYLSYEDN